MSNTAATTREYLAERITHLEEEVKSVSLNNGQLIFAMKGIITELRQTLNVLNGGKSAFQKVEEVQTV
jgi:hypothetical protein